jgi:hypothetical protein
MSSFYDYCQKKIPKLFINNNAYLKTVCDFIDKNRCGKKIIIVNMSRKSGKSTLSKLLACFLEEINEESDSHCRTAIIVKEYQKHADNYNEDLIKIKQNVKSDIKFPYNSLIGATGCILDDPWYNSDRTSHLTALRNAIDRCRWILDCCYCRSTKNFPVIIFETIIDEYSVSQHLIKALKSDCFVVNTENNLDKP